MTRQHSLQNGETVQSETPVLLVGGGRPAVQDIVNSVTLAPLVVAADGGANFCLEAGVQPHAVVGDFDSVSEATRTSFPGARWIEYADQNLTDFEKALSLVDAPLVIALGFTEGRLDHTLANLAVLARRVGSKSVLLGSDDLALAAPETLSLSLPPGTRLSLFPMRPTRGSSEGLKWSIDGLTLDPMGRLGISNEVTGLVHLAFDTPGTIVLIPRAHLTAAIAALTD